MDLDPELAERILEPYPELLTYWRSELDRLAQTEWFGEVERMHNPRYLREVVRQHKWVTEGPGDYVDPAVAAEIEGILDQCPAVRAERDEEVSSPWIRAMSLRPPYFATRWYNPRHARMRVHQVLHPRPYDSPEEQHMRDLSAAIRAGGQITMTDMETGRAVRLDSDADRFVRRETST